jgi:hypothetical protein
VREESFAWEPRDAAKIVDEHNERVLRRATEDEFAKAVADAFLEATLENAWRNIQEDAAKLRATRDTAAIRFSTERWRTLSDVKFVAWLTEEK